MESVEQILERFKQAMLLELNNNSHKGSILEFKDFSAIITELEYHKAKLFIAIKVKDKKAIREYIADTANNLVALGNLFDLYSQDILDDGKVCELDTEGGIIKHVEKDNIKTNQKLI